MPSRSRGRRGRGRGAGGATGGRGAGGATGGPRRDRTPHVNVNGIPLNNISKALGGVSGKPNITKAMQYVSEKKPELTNERNVKKQLVKLLIELTKRRLKQSGGGRTGRTVKTIHNTTTPFRYNEPGHRFQIIQPFTALLRLKGMNVTPEFE